MRTSCIPQIRYAGQNVGIMLIVKIRALQNSTPLEESKTKPNQTIINESGLYSLVLSSKPPNAKRANKYLLAPTSGDGEIKRTDFVGIVTTTVVQIQLYQLFQSLEINLRNMH